MSDLLKLKSQMVVNHHMVLEIGPGVSVGATRALTTEQSLKKHFCYYLCIFICSLFFSVVNMASQMLSMHSTNELQSIMLTVLVFFFFYY